MSAKYVHEINRSKMSDKLLRHHVFSFKTFPFRLPEKISRKMCFCAEFLITNYYYLTGSISSSVLITCNANASMAISPMTNSSKCQTMICWVIVTRVTREWKWGHFGLNDFSLIEILNIFFFRYHDKCSLRFRI